MYDLSGVPGYWLVVRRSRVVGLRARGHLAASETAGTATGDYLHTAPSQTTPLRGTHGILTEVTSCLDRCLTLHQPSFLSNRDK